MTKRILYLHPHFTLPGGAGRFALETAQELSNRGWDVHIAAIRINDSFVKSAPGATFHTLGGPLSNSIFYWSYLPLLLLRVLRLIHTLKPDVVFSQVFPANWWGFIAKKIFGKAVTHVWMCQEPSAFIHSQRWIKALPFSAAGIGARVLNPLLRWIDVSLSVYTDKVFANSEFSKKLALKAYRYTDAHVGICYPGVDVLRFHFSTEVKKIHYQCIACARLTKFKNIDKVLEMIAAFNRAEVTAVIIGDGEEYDALHMQAQRLQIQDKVIFRKTVSDSEMVHALQSAFVLLHPAEEEPFGLAPVEAMACGTPVIAMRDGGPAETIEEGKTGILCDNASATHLQTALKSLMNQQDSAITSATCVERAKLFTWKNAVDTLETGFNEILTDKND